MARSTPRGAGDGARDRPAELESELSRNSYVILDISATMRGSASRSGKLEHAIQTVGSLAGIPTTVSIQSYKGASDLGGRVASEGLSVVYIMPGLHSAVSNIAAALSGQSVLSVAASPDDVLEGTALGFALEEGKPKILVNLEAAKAQGVDFRSALLKVARVV